MLWKKLTVISLVVALVFSAGLAAAQTLPCNPDGDVGGVLNFRDVVALLRLLLQGTPLPVGGTGDCDGDDDVDFRDLLALLQALRPPPI
jgi:hypothetical protein